MAREYFCAYHSYLQSMKRLSDVEVGRLFRAMLKYSETGILDDLSGNERFVADTIIAQIDRDKQKYARKCDVNRENGSKSSGAFGSERGRTVANGGETHKEKEKEKEKTKEKEKERGVVGGDEPPARPRFSPPTLEDVRQYCLSQGYAMDPARFVDYYTANGWRVGRNPMKDWKAAVRSWVSRDKPNEPQRGGADRLAEMINRGDFD